MFPLAEVAVLGDFVDFLLQQKVERGGVVLGAEEGGVGLEVEDF